MAEYKKEMLPLLVQPLLDRIKDRTLVSTIKELINGKQCNIKKNLLLKAIKQRENPANVVDFFLSYGIPDLSSYELLHTAAMLPNVEVMKVLLRHGYYVDFEDENGTTALDIAIEARHVDMVALLLAHGAICSNRLPQVALQDNLPLVKLIYQYEKTSYLQTKSQSPIYLAAKKGHLEVVKFFLLKNIPYDKQQLFSHALQSKSSALIAFLLKKDIYDKAKMKEGKIASSKLVIAGILLFCIVGSVLIVHQGLQTIEAIDFTQVSDFLSYLSLIDSKIYYSCLFVWGIGLLVFYGYKRMLPQDLDKYIHIVAKKGHTAVMQALLPYTPIDLQAPFEEVQNMTPLHIAVVYKHLAMVQFLVKKGTMLHAVATNKENINKTPLDFCEETNSAIYKFLIKHGAKHAEV